MSSRINRNIVECKFLRCGSSGKIFEELIETLWNVNGKLFTKDTALVKELIETLWNVNTGGRAQPPPAL